MNTILLVIMLVAEENIKEYQTEFYLWKQILQHSIEISLFV